MLLLLLCSCIHFYVITQTKECRIERESECVREIAKCYCFLFVWLYWHFLFGITFKFERKFLRNDIFYSLCFVIFFLFFRNFLFSNVKWSAKVVLKVNLRFKLLKTCKIFECFSFINKSKVRETFLYDKNFDNFKWNCCCCCFKCTYL